MIPRPSNSDSGTNAPAGRETLLLLFGCGVLWLVLSAVLALIASIQAHVPGFFADCPLFTYGRTLAMRETALVYGWLANSGLALALLVLRRLGGGLLRGRAWAATGAVFWNVGVAIGMLGIAFGDATGIPFLEFPRYAQPLMLASYCAIAVGGVLAWTGRRRQVMYASQWYAVAALFLLPWLFSAAQVMLLWFPVPGVMKAIAAGWFSQGLWTLWIAPLALSAAYYLVPKLTGRTLPAYEMAPIAFWCLLFIGGWTGGRHLIGGPVPAWIGTVAVVTSAVLLFHYIVVAINLRPAFAYGAGWTLRFVGFGVGAYVLGGFVDSVMAVRSVAVAAEFTYCDEALRELALTGAASMVLFGGLYYALPGLAGRPLYSVALQRAQYLVTAFGIFSVVGGLAAAGLAQGRGLNDASVSFSAIAGQVRPGLFFASVGDALLLLGNLLLAVNFFKTAACPFYAAEAAAAAASPAPSRT